MADEEKYIDAYGVELGKGFSEWKTGNSALDDHFNDFFDIRNIMKEKDQRDTEPFIDKASNAAFNPMYLTGGTLQTDNTWVADGTGSGFKLTEPEKAGKWEWWGIECAGGLRNLFTTKKYKEKLPSYGTDDLLVVGAGRGLLPFYLGDTGLSNNAGMFKNIVSVEKDEELVNYTKKVINDTGISNIQAVCNNSLSEPQPQTDDYAKIVSRQYDVIIATLPFSDRAEGIYHLKQQERTLRKEIEERNRYEGENWPLDKERDFYDYIAKWEDKCYDENFGNHRALFRKASSLLKPDGMLVSIHNTMTSDIDTFKPMIEESNLKLVHHTLIDRGLGANSVGRHWFLRRVLVKAHSANMYAMVTKKK
tara:strand:+ start:1795 stop:2883 length:1089 start_codon:yes stop_codon:yes gene_type:complete